MIASLSGTILQAHRSSVVIDVAGVGYLVHVTEPHALTLRAGTQTRLTTHLIVREDSMTLYGFLDEAAHSLFELLLGVTGVGPKSALAVLGTVGTTNIAHAVAAEDDAVFRKVSGIGPKTAKLIVLSLTGKVFPTATAAATTPESSGLEQVQLALQGLGWTERLAEDAAQRAADSLGLADSGVRNSDVGTVLRAALTLLGGTPKTTQAGGR